MRRRRLIAFGALAALGMREARFAWPQSGSRIYRIGILSIVESPSLTDPLLAALGRRGWIAGRNLQVDTRTTAGDAAKAAAIAREFAEQRVDLIVTLTTGNAVAARQVTSSIPIVMLGSGYPVEAGLAQSLAHPDGNVTGVSVYAGSEIWGKYVSLAREVAPRVRDLDVLFDYVVSERELEPLRRELQMTAKALGMRLRFWRVRSDPDLVAALAEVEKAAVGAILVTNGPVHAQPANVTRVNGFALRRRLPMINDVAGNVFRGGGLLAYSFTPQELAERCASMIDRILRGTRAGDLPIEFPTRFELTINAKTAKAIGVELPQSLLLRADHVLR